MFADARRPVLPDERVRLAYEAEMKAAERLRLTYQAELKATRERKTAVTQACVSHYVTELSDSETCRRGGRRGGGGGGGGGNEEACGRQ